MNDFVDALINRLKIEYERQDRSGVYAITQRLLAYNSNKIEGSTLTEEQTASLFDVGTIYANGQIIKARDVEEMRGHFAMFNEMLKTYDSMLSHEIIKLYHYRLKSGVFDDLVRGYPIGEYKNRKNIVGSIATALPSEVHDKMTQLLDSYNKMPNHTIEDLVRFHVSYESIHPFQDGNGRTGRLILYKECLRNGIPPFVILDSNKSVYIHALHHAQTNGDHSLLISMFEDEQKYYRQLVEDFL